jgi:hypothetical protein
LRQTWKRGEVDRPLAGEAVVALQEMIGQQNVIHVGLVQIGPVLPPQMIIERLISVAPPHSFFSAVPKPLSCLPIQSAFLTDHELLFKGKLSLSLGLAHAHACHENSALLPRRRQVAKLLEFDDVTVAEQTQEMDPPLFSASPIQSVIRKKRGRAKKSEPAIVDTTYITSTRSCTNRDGHKPVSMSDTVARPRKKGKIQKKKIIQDSPVPDAETEQVADDHHETDESSVQIPPETPVHIMQHVGVALGIDPAMLTEEKIKAPSKAKSTKEVSNDK